MTCKLQLNEVIGTVIRQDKMLTECHDKIEILQSHINRSNLRIQGIPEEKEEDCAKKVQTFFKDMLGIQQDINIDDAFRIGKGDGRPIK